jgi:hypothetical protein
MSNEMSDNEKVEKGLMTIKEYYQTRPYTLRWNEPDTLVFPKGAWIVQDWTGKFVKEYKNKNCAQKYCDSLNAWLK